MTALMTRERLAELREKHDRYILESWEDAELLDACEALLNKWNAARDTALEEAAIHFETIAERIETNARDPNRPNVGCSVRECLEAAQEERQKAVEIRTLKGKQ